MSANSSIEWTDRTWNPVRGCSIVSPGCVNCYAMKQAHRFSGKGKDYEGLTKQTAAGPQWTGKIRTVGAALTEPLKWKTAQRVFVNSMSDLFHEGVGDFFIDCVFAVMALAPQHTFQILTKRPERMLAYVTARSRSAQPWKDAARAVGYSLDFEGRSLVSFPLKNVWIGVSAENQEQADKRIPFLLQTPAAVRFVSYEPALGPIDFAPWVGNVVGYEASMAPGKPPSVDAFTVKRGGVDWIIVGGESGPRARDFAIEWARIAVDQCRRAGVACFVKQIGPNPVENGRRALLRHGSSWLFKAPIDRKGGDMAQWPEDLRVRQFPSVRP